MEEGLLPAEGSGATGADEIDRFRRTTRNGEELEASKGLPA